MGRMLSLEELWSLGRNVKEWCKNEEIDGTLVGRSVMFWGPVKIQNIFFGMVDGIDISVGHYEAVDTSPSGYDVYRIEARIGNILLGREEAKNGKIRSFYYGARSRYEKRETAPDVDDGDSFENYRESLRK